MTPDDIREHGALGAAHSEIKALREQYADAITSLDASVLATVEVGTERTRLRARIEAVRALLPEATHEPRCSLWAGVPVYGQPMPCDCVLSRIAAALETPLEPGPPALGRRGALPGTRVTPDPPDPLRSATTEGDTPC